MKKSDFKEKVVATLKKNKFTERFTDYYFRTVFFTALTLLLTVCYAAFYFIMGIIASSTWYGVLAAYYLMIVAMRSAVVIYHKKNKSFSDETAKVIREIKIYSDCGVVIIFLTITIIVAVLQIVIKKATFSHSGMMIYAAALYTTIKVITTINNYLKAKKLNNFTIQTVRNINLADMFVSVLALQTAMFNSFSPEEDWSVFNAVTGAVVCVLNLILGFTMLVKGRRELKAVRSGEDKAGQLQSDEISTEK